MSGIINSVGSRSGVIGTTELDYEEGTATVAFATGSGSLTVNTDVNTIAYIKIGNVVYIRGRLRMSSDSSPSGSLHMTGLPFTSRASVGEDADHGITSVMIEYAKTAITNGINGKISASSTQMLIAENGMTTDGEATLAAKCDSGTWISVGGFYFT